MDHDSDQLLRAQLQRLRGGGFIIEEGLSDYELEVAQKYAGCTFPPDLRSLLQIGLPVGNKFPNWRVLDDSIRVQLDWPIDGICFDIQNRVFWWDNWGERPESNGVAIAKAMRLTQDAPKLIPVFGHVYIPSFGQDRGNPLFSVHQADVIHRGGNLQRFLESLFRNEKDDEIDLVMPVFDESYRYIPFWSDVAKANAT